TANAGLMEGSMLKGLCGGKEGSEPSAIAYGYITGVLDAIDVYEATPSGRRGPNQFCIPAYVKNQQVYELVCQHMWAQPEPHALAYTSIYVALRETFPCVN